MTSRPSTTGLDELGETLSRLGAAFAQAEEQARQSVRRAERAAAGLADEVSQMQAQAQEHLAGTAKGIVEAEKARADAVDGLASAESVRGRLRALHTQASASVDTWIDALERARRRVQSGRSEMSQVQDALATAKARVVARDSEHAAAAVRGLREGDAHLERTAAAREHSRAQLRLVMARLKAVHEQVAVLERTLTRCKTGAERAVELARAAWESLQAASDAVALAREGLSLGEAAVRQQLRSRPDVEEEARSAHEAAAAASAMSAALARSVLLVRVLSESQAERQALCGRGLAALEEARCGLVPGAGL